MALIGGKPQYNMAGGLIGKPKQGFDWQGLLSNPMLHAGIGLLGSTGREGPQAALKGALQGVQLRQQFDQQAQEKAKQERLQQLSGQLPGLYEAGGIEGVGSALLGTPETMGAGASLLGRAQTAQQGLQGIQGSPFKLGSGNMGYLTKTGQIVDTGTPFHSAPNTFEAGGIRYSINPITGQAQPLVAPTQVAETQSQIAAATEGAKTTAKAEAESRAQAPQAVENANNIISVIDKAINHPGRELATGFTSVFNPVQPAGSSARDFLTVTDQLKGAAFLQAFESLKGGGQITEVEGKKATDAMARLNEAQSEGEYLQALKDLREVVARGRDRAAGKLEDMAKPMSEADYNALPSGAIYIDPDDGKQYRKP